MIKLNSCFPVKMRRAILSDSGTLCDFINYSYGFKNEYITTIKEIHNKPRMTYSMMENTINSSKTDIFIYYLEGDNDALSHSDYYKRDNKYIYFKIEKEKDLIGTSCIELKSSCSFFNEELFKNNSHNILKNKNSKFCNNNELNDFHMPKILSELKSNIPLKSKFYLGSCCIHPFFLNRGLGLQLLLSNILYIQFLKLIFSSQTNINKMNSLLEKSGFTVELYKKAIMDYFKLNFNYNNFNECYLYDLKNAELINNADSIYLFYVSNHLEGMLKKLGFKNEITRKKLKDISYFVENTDLTEFGKEQIAILRERGIFDDTYLI